MSLMPVFAQASPVGSPMDSSFLFMMLMVLGTTFVTPPALSWIVKRSLVLPAPPRGSVDHDALDALVSGEDAL